MKKKVIYKDIDDDNISTNNGNWFFDRQQANIQENQSNKKTNSSSKGFMNSIPGLGSPSKYYDNNDIHSPKKYMSALRDMSNGHDPKELKQRVKKNLQYQEELAKQILEKKRLKHEEDNKLILEKRRELIEYYKQLNRPVPREQLDRLRPTEFIEELPMMTTENQSYEKDSYHSNSYENPKESYHSYRSKQKESKHKESIYRLMNNDEDERDEEYYEEEVEEVPVQVLPKRESRRKVQYDSEEEEESYVKPRKSIVRVVKEKLKKTPMESEVDEDIQELSYLYTDLLKKQQKLESKLERQAHVIDELKASLQEKPKTLRSRSNSLRYEQPLNVQKSKVQTKLINTRANSTKPSTRVAFGGSSKTERFKVEVPAYVNPKPKIPTKFTDPLQNSFKKNSSHSLSNSTVNDLYKSTTRRSRNSNVERSLELDGESEYLQVKGMRESRNQNYDRQGDQLDRLLIQARTIRR